MPLGKLPHPGAHVKKFALEHTIGKFLPLSRGPSAHGLVPWEKPGPIPPPLGTSKSNRDTLPAGMGSWRGTIGPAFAGEAFEIATDDARQGFYWPFAGCRAMSSQPSGVTVARSPGRKSTVVIGDSIIAGPAMFCFGASAPKP